MEVEKRGEVKLKPSVVVDDNDTTRVDQQLADYNVPRELGKNITKKYI